MIDALSGRAMRVFMFRPRFAAPIQAGTKRQTIRGTTRARPGDLICPRIWAGRPYHSLQIPLIAPTPCTAVTPVSIAADFFALTLEIWVAGEPLMHREVRAFARADGFESKTDMILYYRDRKVEAFTGVLIQWEKAP